MNRRINTPELLDRPIFTVKTKEDLKKAMLMASIGLFTKFTVIVEDATECLGENYFTVMEEAIDESEWTSGFSTTQERTFPCKFYYDLPTERIVMEGQKEYYFDVNRKNDLYNQCASIAAEMAWLREDGPEEDLFYYFHKWLQTHIRYEQNNVSDDYNALKTLETGHGVCQAISAIACRVFENLGYPSAFMYGKYGRGKTKWPHCWNAIKRSGKWHQYDFTHCLGLDYIPCTDIFNKNEPFARYRSWDAGLYNENAFDEYVRRIHEIRNQELTIRPWDEKFYSGGILITTVRPIMKVKDGVPLLNLDFIYSLWGGGCMYDKSDRLLKTFTFDWRNDYLQPDENFDNRLDADGFVGLETLRRLGLKFEYDGMIMKLRF